VSQSSAPFGGEYGNRPDRIGSGQLKNPSITKWFDPSAFAVVPTNSGIYGNAGRNILRGPGSDNWDMSLMKDLIDTPHVPFGVSDGGAHTKFLTAGRFPTEGIVKYCREKGWLSLEDIHWRLSALPAFIAGFKDRGFLREGAPADLVVYDFDKLNVLPIEVTRDLPGNEWRRVQKAEGYRWIVVNGQVTFHDSECTGATPGKLLRHGAGA